MIKNYGLFWKRDDVHWGLPNNKGTLLGVLKANKTGKKVNFREQQGIYVLYDTLLNPVYVGQTIDLFARLKQHTSDDLRIRWSYFSWFGLKSVTKKGKISEKRRTGSGGAISTILDEFEGILIAAFEPNLNKQGAKFNGDEYLQVVDENDRTATLQDIWEALRPMDKITI